MNFVVFSRSNKKIYRFFLYDIPNMHLKCLESTRALTSKILRTKKLFFFWLGFSKDFVKGDFDKKNRHNILFQDS